VCISDKSENLKIGGSEEDYRGAELAGINRSPDAPLEGSRKRGGKIFARMSASNE
jgi:hypothetical protein